MTDDDIIRMAREAAAKHGHTLRETPSDAVAELLVQLVRDAMALEREACAKVCEDVSHPAPGEAHSDSQWAALCLAAAIRARGAAIDAAKEKQ